MGDIETLQEWISTSNDIVFFGGAGVSTESGIPDFRSVDGLYNQQYKYPPEVILSHSFFVRRTKEFYDFYRNKMICLDAKPNKAHLKLAELENEGRLKAVITQNIDGLHQMAGSKNVLELHGSIHRSYCMKCRKKYGIEFILESKNIPMCSCGGIIKPDVVLYEEGLNNDILEDAIKHIAKTEMLIVGGTSLAVYPAAGLVNYYRGKKLVMINKSSTRYDKNATLILQGSIGEILGKIV